MLVGLLLLLLSFALIIGGAVLFTNAVEWLGAKLNLGHGPVGSILAAVATALPESTIPVVALVSGSSGEGKQIALGAIIGAPFLLGTLAMLLVGVSAAGFMRRRRHGRELRIDLPAARRDLMFFLVLFTIAVLLAVGLPKPVRIGAAIALAVAYGVYVWLTIRKGGGADEEEEDLTPLRFDFSKEDPPNWFQLIAQLVVSIGMIVGGAELFVHELESVAKELGVQTLVLALILAPLATELPEKANSILWVREEKDTLALGNITGAMVFQSTVPVAFGMAFTEWDFDKYLFAASICGLVGGAIALWRVHAKKFGVPAMVAWAGLFTVFTVYVVVDSTKSQQQPPPPPPPPPPRAPAPPPAPPPPPPPPGG
jgi:cation:H+ antiporter